MLKKKYSIKPLFDFDSLIDVNLAALILLKYKYNNPKYVRETIAFSDAYFMQCMLLTSPTKNPMHIFVKEEYEESYESLYRDILKDPDIERYYTLYNTGTLLSILLEMDFIYPEILCKSEQEKNALDKRIPGLKYNIVPDGEKIDINDKFDTYYMGDVFNIDNRLDNPMGIEFRALEFKYNMQTDKRGMPIPLVEAIAPYSDTNKFCFVQPYKNIILPEGETLWNLSQTS